MKLDRKQNTKRNIVWGVVGKVATLLPSFAVRTLIIHYLGVEYLGLNSLFASILQVLSLAELGFDSAITYSLYRPVAEDDTESVCALLRLYRRTYRIIGVCVLAGGLCVLPFLPKLIKGSTPADVSVYLLFLVYLANTSLSYLFFAYRSVLLNVHQRVDISDKVSSLIFLLTYALQAVAVVALRNYYAYVLTVPLSTLLINLMKYLITKRLYPQYVCRGDVSDECRAGIRERVSGMLLYRVGDVLRNSFDSIILSKFLGLVVVACYQNYFMIMNMVSTFIGTIAAGVVAGVGNSIACEPVEKNYGDFETFTFLMLWISGFCAVCLLCLYQPFMELWVGKQNMLGFELVIMFSIYFLVGKLGDITYVYSSAAGLWHKDRMRPVVDSVANLTLNILLVRRFGVAGVLLSTILTLGLISLPWSIRTVFRYYFVGFSKRAYYAKIGAFCGVIVVAAALTYLACAWIPLTGVPLLIARAAVCCVLPNGLFLLVFRKTDAFARALLLCKSMLAARK